MEDDPEDSQRPPATPAEPQTPGEAVSQPEDVGSPSPSYPAAYHRDEFPDAEEEEGGPIKSFLEHLEDLRWVLIKVASVIILAMIICLVAAPTLITVLRYPVANAGLPVEIDLKIFGPIGGFMISLKLGFYGGMVIALPFILFFVGEFVVPALKQKEKKYFLRAFTIGTAFFLLGLVVCYFYIMPLSLRGLVQYNKWLGMTTEMWQAEVYFEFATKFLLGVGLLFEVPVVVLSLVRLGVIPHHILVKGRSYMFVINFVFCAVITPADLVTTFLMAIVLQVCFEICILISSFWEKQKKKRRIQEEKDN